MRKELDEVLGLLEDAAANCRQAVMDHEENDVAEAYEALKVATRHSHRATRKLQEVLLLAENEILIRVGFPPMTTDEEQPSWDA